MPSETSASRSKALLPIASCTSASVSLNTAVLDMQLKNGKIIGVTTNRGTNSILDKKAGAYFGSIASVKELNRQKTHSKGGGILHTVHDNLLVGPDAVETWEKENTETNKESIETVFRKQTRTMPSLSQRDIITYFTGIRAPTFEEDFIIEMGRKTENILHCAGIQSPGLTTAPAVALDIEKMAVEYLPKTRQVEKNADFDPVCHAPPVLNRMDDESPLPRTGAVEPHRHP